MERGVLVQRSVGPRLIIVGSISAYDPAQVRFPEHDDVVQALPADRANEPLNVSTTETFAEGVSSAPKQFGARRLVPTRKGKPRRSGARTSWKGNQDEDIATDKQIATVLRL